ncbi:hypothetical protein [Micromonospora sp. KC207]|uniref:hypothetical protein n=1 Tax=Micromonospora sp. KC207 TaxID=2530377 RepID=UPI001FB732E5|nr:hypothetical protein [Micromonospora sp. KC207]
MVFFVDEPSTGDLATYRSPPHRNFLTPASAADFDTGPRSVVIWPTIRAAVAFSATATVCVRAAVRTLAVSALGCPHAVLAQVGQDAGFVGAAQPGWGLPLREEPERTLLRRLSVFFMAG